MLQATMFVVICYSSFRKLKHKLLELVSIIRKVVRHKVNTQKLTIFLSATDKLKTRIKYSIYNNIKFLLLNPMKEVEP